MAQRNVRGLPDEPFNCNAWSAAACDHEVPADGLFAHAVIGEPPLLTRNAYGAIVAAKDRSIEVPGMETSPQAACVRRFTVVKHRRRFVQPPHCRDSMRTVSTPWLTRIKTTIEVPDDLLARGKAVARQENSTPEALIEESLRPALRMRSRTRGAPFAVQPFLGDGLSPEFAVAGWAKIRHDIYRDRG